MRHRFLGVDVVMGHRMASVVMVMNLGMRESVFGMLWQVFSFRRAIPFLEGSFPQDFGMRMHVTFLSETFEWHRGAGLLPSPQTTAAPLMLDQSFQND